MFNSVENFALHELQPSMFLPEYSTSREVNVYIVNYRVKVFKKRTIIIVIFLFENWQGVLVCMWA